MYFFIERIYLKSIGEKIERKDKRTIKDWCKLNHLKVFKDSSGDFVYMNDFDLAYDMPLILELQARYGEGWADYYSYYNKDELIKILQFHNESRGEKSSYIPKGKITSKILKKK